MLRILKMSGGALLLLLFLFPQAQKAWHDFEHRHDTHCYATAEVHLHQLEHVCNLCDFSIAAGFENTITNYEIFLSAVPFSFLLCSIKSTPVAFWQPLPPRAPPVFLL